MERGIRLRVFFIAAFGLSFLCLLISNVFYLYKEQEIKSYLSRTNSWVAWQIEKEHLRFLGAVDELSIEATDAAHENALLYFDLLLSRFPVALNGTESAFLRDDPEALETVLSLRDAVLGLETAIFNVDPANREALLRVREQVHSALGPFADDLSRLTASFSTGRRAQELFDQVFRNQRISLYLTVGLLVTATTILGFLVVEVLRRRRYAAEQEQLYRRAEAASAAKSAFLANMSHELRTPLNAVIGFSEIMRSEAFGPVGSKRYHSYLGDIHQAGNHLLNVVNAVLDIAKLERSEINLDEGRFLIDEVLDFAVSVHEPHRVREEKQFDVQRGVDDDTTIEICGDLQMFRQILLNILSNAVKFTPAHGCIGIICIVRTDRLEIRVEDDGPGIDRRDRRRVFDPFFQADQSWTRSHQGAGLGLPIARGFAREHGGDLWLESEPGEGTTAVLTLPRDRISLVPNPRVARAGHRPVPGVDSEAVDPVTPDRVTADQVTPDRAAG